jgi:hypothetical protein
MDVVSPHQHVNLDARTVLELGLDMIPVIDEPGETVPSMQTLRWQPTH